MKLNAQEKAAIKQLQALAEIWPETLGLFSNGTLSVMKLDPQGKTAVTPEGGIDPDYVVATVYGIHSDGGDW